MWLQKIVRYCTSAVRSPKNAVLSNTFASRKEPMKVTLLGPPEIYRSSAATTDTKQQGDHSTGLETTPTTTTKSDTSDPFMDAMVSHYNKMAEEWNMRYLGWTENRSRTYLSSGNPCLDFFFHVVPDTPAHEVTSRLKLAWEQDPSTALKLVFNLRGIRGSGKSDKEGFYASALWLHENHPKTLAANVAAVAEFGYFKDLLEILYRLVEGADVRKVHKDLASWSRYYSRYSRYYTYGWLEKAKDLEKEGVKQKTREEKRIISATKGLEKYNQDPNYQFLHDCISQLFAEHIASDLEKLKSGNLWNFSLASKWCPSLYSSFDYSTLICESIAKRLFPKEEHPEYEGIKEAHYAYRVRDRLRKEALTPLRRALKLPEVFMSAREWASIVYTRVASVAMKNYTETFTKRDGERFQAYLDSVKKGKKKIAAGALLPHQIVDSVKHKKNEVAELQWKTIIEDLAKIGKLKNCLAICDVSGSMHGTPLDVSVALGLLVSELSEEPWKGKLITFSSRPQLQVIKGDDLHSKINFIERMDWEMNTDFQKVFDLILEVAVEGKLTEEQMIKRLFVFSDMEFDQASTNKWETDYQAIVRKFNEKGFSRVPEIVFWNLRNSSATPVPSHQEGVALVSGFSKNIVKLFLEEGGVLDPVTTMEAAISGKEYETLVVVD